MEKVFFCSIMKCIDKFNKEINDLCESKVASGFMYEMQKAYPSNLATAFCSNECPCKATRDRFPTSSEYDSGVYNNKGAENVMKCPKTLFESNPPHSEIIGFLATLEERFRCSGLCSREKWFYFSDVSKGAPIYPCQSQIRSYIQG